MSEMPAFSRWFINRSTGRRARSQLAAFGPHLVLPTGARLLELGAGRGGLSARLYEQYRPARLVVTDYDPAQVAEATEYLGRRWNGWPAGVELRSANALSLPFDRSTFDAVFAMDVLHHVEARHADYAQRPTALREIRRVLVPGGHFVFAEFTRVPDVEATLRDLGFVAEFGRRRWPHHLTAIYRRAPDEAPPPMDGSRKS